MAFTIVVGGVVRHVAYCAIAGQVSVTKRDWQCTSMSGGSSMASADIIDALSLMVAPLYSDAMSQNAQYYGSQLYYQTPVGAKPRPDSTRAGTTDGVELVGLLPTQTCGLVSLYTDTLGKTGQGRMYVPFPAQNQMDDNGTPVALYLTVLGNLGLAHTTNKTIISGGVTGVFTPVLYVPGGVPPKPIIKYIVRDAWATQRRRGSFGRTNSMPF